VQAEPADVSAGAVAAALREHWGSPVAELRYAPVGFGGYHWVAVASSAQRRFVTVTDLADTPAQLADWDACCADLRAAMSTAAGAAGAGLDLSSLRCPPPPGGWSGAGSRVMP
jgi:spectinomycin phosphotransferase